MSLKSVFSKPILIAPLIAPLGLAGLSGCDPQTPPPPALQQATPAFVEPAAALKVETLMRGDTFDRLEDGVYRVTIPAAQAGTPRDLEVLLFKDQDGHGNPSRGYGGISADWVKAYGLHETPTPRTRVPAPSRGFAP